MAIESMAARNYIGFQRLGVRDQFRVAIGAWNPGDPRPAGMPAEAINLADVGVVTDLAIISKPFDPAWIEAYTMESLVTPFGLDDISIEVGTPAQPTKFTASGVPALLVLGLQYPTATLETQIQITIHATVGTLADLIAGQGVINVLAARWDPRIERLSP